MARGRGNGEGSITYRKKEGRYLGRDQDTYDKNGIND